jgi:hypothetical protein
LEEFVWNETDTSSITITAPSGQELVTASVDVEGPNVSIETVTDIIEGGYVSAQLEFHPVGASYLKLDNIWGGSSGEAYPNLTLLDLTANETLFYLWVANGVFGLDQAFPSVIPYNEIFCDRYSGECYDVPSGEPVGPYDYPLSSGMIPVDPSHSYLLRNYVEVGTSDEGSVSANISLVPEPSTLLLSGIGLLSLVLLRRRYP